MSHGAWWTAGIGSRSCPAAGRAEDSPRGGRHARDAARAGRPRLGAAGSPTADARGLSGIKRLNFDIVRLFVAPMPYQAKALAELMAQKRFDAILADYGFFGVLPFVLGDRAARPPVVLYATTPMMFSSRDTAPGGLGLPPSTSSLGRLRNRTLNLLSQKVLLRQSQKAANYQLHRLNSARATDVPAGFRRAGRPLHRADRARIRLSAHRSASQCPLRRNGAPERRRQKFRPPAWWREARR